MLWRPWPLLALAACVIIENPGYKDPGLDGGALTGGAPTSDAATDVATTDVPTTNDSETTTTLDVTTTTPPDPTTTTTDTVTDTGDTCTPDVLLPPCAAESIDGYNYLVCEDVVEYKLAANRCIARCASLVMFTESSMMDNKESEKLAKLLRDGMTPDDTAEEMQIDMGNIPLGQSERASWWIGGNRRDDDLWHWLSDTLMPAQGKGGWAPMDPDPNPESGLDCATLVIFGAKAQNFKWFDHDCAKPHRYICEL